MDDTTDTPQTFSRRGWRKHHKHLFRLGCELLDISYRQVATICDEDLSTVKAWASAHRDHAVPDWAMHRIRRRLPQLGAFIDKGMEALPDVALPCAADADTQTAVTAQKLCEVLALLVAILPDGVDPAEGERALPPLLHAAEHITRLVQQYQRLVTGAAAGARGVA